MVSITDPCELLYVSDLDGTLLDSDGQLPEDSIQRLNRLIDKGLNFTIATARNYDSAYPLLQGLNLKLPVILFNWVRLQATRAALLPLRPWVGPARVELAPS